MRRFAVGILVMGALALVAAACASDEGAGPGSTPTDGTAPAGTEGPEEVPQPGGTLRIGLATDMPGWNPAQDQFTLSGYQVSAAVYDVLVRYDADGIPQPYLAESIEPNEDFTTWTITLRPGISFHDGTPLDAEVLALNLTQTKESPLLGQVFGAVEAIEVTGDLEVTVQMATPWASFPDTLTAQPGLVVAPSVFEDASRPVGTGPFVFERHESGSTLTVTRNPDYWQEGYPLLDGIEFRILSDSQARADALRAGDVDMIEIRSANEIVAFEEDDEFVLYLDTYGEATEVVLALNTAVAPFDDPDARAAVSYGVDRAGLAETVYAGRYRVAAGPFAEDSPWYQDVAFPGDDPERAREALAVYEARTGQPLRFDLLVTTDPAAGELAGYLDQQLSELGIEVEVVSRDATSALVSVLQGDYQMTATDALFGSGHPDREYTFIRSANALPPPQLATNFTRVQSDDIDAGLEQARATGDRAAQSAAWAQVQEGLAAEMPFIFLVHTELGDAASPAVRGLREWTLPGSDHPGLPQDQNVVTLHNVWLAQ